jgi:hypothetical protein
MAAAFAPPVFPETAVAMLATLPIWASASPLIPAFRTTLAAESAALGRRRLLVHGGLLPAGDRLVRGRLGTSPIFDGGSRSRL